MLWAAALPHALGGTYGFAGCWDICVLRSAPVPNARGALQKQLWRPAADLVDRVVRQRHDIEIAVRALLDAGRRAEPLANLQRLALSALEFRGAEEVVSDAVGQAWIGADVDVQTVCRHMKAIEAAAVVTHLLEGAGRSHP